MAMELPLDEATKLEAEIVRQLRDADASDDISPSFEQMRAALGRTKSNEALGSGFMGETGKAIEFVFCERGEHVTENKVSRFGICQLRIVRLGAPVEEQLYFEQVRSLDGVSGLRGWAWTDRENGQEMHVLLLVWKQE
jgi:hypothetical protein